MQLQGESTTGVQLAWEPLGTNLFWVSVWSGDKAEKPITVENAGLTLCHVYRCYVERMVGLPLVHMH